MTEPNTQREDEIIEKIRNCYVIIDSNGSGDEDVREIIADAHQEAVESYRQELRKKVEGLKEREESPSDFKLGHRTAKGDLLTIISE